LFSGKLLYSEKWEDCTLPLPAKREEWMAVFHIYGDESGKMSSNVDRTSFCGYVAHSSVWQIFATNWNNCRFKWQVPPIHMSRIMFPDSTDDQWKKVKADWGTVWEKKRDLMLEDLASIVKSADIACVGAVVDSKHFRFLADSDPDFKKLYRDPVHLAFHTFVMRGIDRTEIIDKSSSIGIVIDNDKEFAVKCYEQLEGLKELADRDQAFARVKERVHAISFVNDNSYPGVQAADMIAYEARRAMVERIKNPDYTSDLYDDITFRRSHQPHFYTPEALDLLQANMKKDLANGTIQL
jgi:hypothetical protein